ncbi:MAG: bifunctional UDP-N-acetylglucosamine diphosphorylase/glucosamine-1-phosphate N-acetyltransferase GlmU, partial [Agrococcus casei]
IQASGGRIEAMPTADPWLVAGVNDRVQLGAAAAELNRRLVAHWQREGVTVQDPLSTWLDIDVRLAQDVTLLPNTQLLGSTTVAAGAAVGPDTTLTDTTVGERASVRRTESFSAVIGADATVGPWAYLRPGTRLGADGKIGTFVETKNAEIGTGSKVPHLSYIGDTEVGQGSNIGAGTITANYDGVRKHRTTVGSHVRTGSHNVFVAPVNIADGAYTGAGTVVRKAVEPGALAISVTPQRNMSGWVQQNRPDSAAAKAAETASEDQNL